MSVVAFHGCSAVCRRRSRFKCYSVCMHLAAGQFVCGSRYQNKKTLKVKRCPLFYPRLVKVVIKSEDQYFGECSRSLLGKYSRTLN